MKTGFTIISLIIITTIYQGTGYTQGDASHKTIVAHKLNERITIDGILNERVWARPGFDELFQQEPHQGEKPSQRTEVWVAYDDDAIYYAAKYYDSSPDSILARLVRRDFVWGDPSDGTVLYLDSYGDKRNGYFFYVNAAGTLADGLLENDSKQTDLSWDAVWEGAPYIGKDGWSVEMRIPLSQLRFKKSETQVWGINVERYISRYAETDMIAYTPRNENGFASRFPALTGIEGIKSSARIEFLPYSIGKAEYVGHDKNNPFNPGHRYSPGLGLDLRAGLGSSFTLNATINPDFGQVELDPAQVNLTDVETAFEERRPFFTEGVNIYRFGNGGTNNVRNFNWPGPTIFYSRRIGRAPQLFSQYENNYEYADGPTGTTILGAAKISGRLNNGWKIGTIHALTQREFGSYALESNRYKFETEPSTYYGVFRLQRDFNGGLQGIGLLSTVTNRFFSDDTLKTYLNNNSMVAGTDGWIFLDRNRTYVLTGWTAVSRVSGQPDRMIRLQRGPGHYFQRPDVDYLKVDSNATSMVGHAGRLMLNKNRGQFTINAAVGWISPGFETNDLGYGAYSDLINMHWAMSYRFAQPTRFYQNAGFNASTYVNHDFGWNKTGQGFSGGAYINFKDLSGANISYTINPRTYNARRTRGGPLTVNPVSQNINLNAYTDNRKWWVLYSGGYTIFGKNENTIESYANIEFKLSTTFTLQLGLEYLNNKFNTQWVTAYSDPYAVNTYNRRYVFANLNQNIISTEIRTDLILTPSLSFQVYIQPYIASGDYSKFMALNRSKSYDFMSYGEDGSTITTSESPSGHIESYTIDPDGSGSASAKSISNPDFNYISLRGNAVLRWEYRKGSTLYFVWTQSRETFESTGDFRVGGSFNRMFDQKPDNIFLVKLSYWL